MTNRAVSQPPPTPHAVARPRCGKLVVFFTRGMSLEGWHRAGILEREIALYRELLSDSVERLAFVTYGGTDDLKWTHVLPRLEILPNRWKIPPNLYSVLSPWLHRGSLRDATVFKTNQINGAWSGVIAKALFRRPLIVRCGFLWADSVTRLTSSRWRRLLARALQGLAFRSADRIVVAGQADKKTMARRYGGDPTRVVVVPNYVDTSRFRPLPDVAPEPGRILFIGRLEDEKNVGALIEAVQTLPDITLTIVGEGSLRSTLESAAHAGGGRFEFLGRQPHERLPTLLCRSHVFMLPSHYEGNPKALVEAMACGVPVVAGRSPGIADVLVDGESGILCGTSPTEIREALRQVLGDAALCERLRAGGLRWVRDRCSLAHAVEGERSVLASLAD